MKNFNRSFYFDAMEKKAQLIPPYVIIFYRTKSAIDTALPMTTCINYFLRDLTALPKQSYLKRYLL